MPKDSSGGFIAISAEGVFSVVTPPKPPTETDETYAVAFYKQWPSVVMNTFMRDDQPEFSFTALHGANEGLTVMTMPRYQNVEEWPDSKEGEKPPGYCEGYVFTDEVTADAVTRFARDILGMDEEQVKNCGDMILFHGRLNDEPHMAAFSPVEIAEWKQRFSGCATDSKKRDLAEAQSTDVAEEGEIAAEEPEAKKARVAEFVALAKRQDEDPDIAVCPF